MKAVYAMVAFLAGVIYSITASLWNITIVDRQGLVIAALFVFVVGALVILAIAKLLLRVHSLWKARKDG